VRIRYLSLIAPSFLWCPFSPCLLFDTLELQRIENSSIMELRRRRRSEKVVALVTLVGVIACLESFPVLTCLTWSPVRLLNICSMLQSISTPTLAMPKQKDVPAGWFCGVERRSAI
jgi:hypothetical protein